LFSKPRGVEDLIFGPSASIMSLPHIASAASPFTPKIVTLLSANPVYATLCGTYLENTQPASMSQPFRLDLEENRTTVRNLLVEIKSDNLRGIRDIADQATPKALHKVSELSGGSHLTSNGVFRTIEALKTRVAQLASDIVAQAHENNWFPKDASSELSHHITVVELIYEMLAKVRSEHVYAAYAGPGYASQKLSIKTVKRKHAETDDHNELAVVKQQLSEGTNQPDKKTPGASGGTVKSPTDRRLVQDLGDLAAALQVPQPQHRQRAKKPRRSGSPLFEQQDAGDCHTPNPEDCQTLNLEGTVSDNAFDLFDAAQESTPDPRSKGQGSAGKLVHKRAESISSEEGWEVLDFSKRGEAAKESEGSAIGYGERKTSSTPQRSSTGVLEPTGGVETGGAVSPPNTDQNRQTALSKAQAPAPAQQMSRRRRSTAMTSEICVSASTYRGLERDFHFMVETCRNLEAQNERLKKRNAELTYLEFAVCQGDCDEELEDAHHRNWDKAQENDALKARIRELEQQAEQDKNKRPLLQTG
jgi:hypothetical protein